MATQGAIYRHHPIPQKITGLLSRACGNRITPYPFGQGHRMPEVSCVLEAVEPLPVWPACGLSQLRSAQCPGDYRIRSTRRSNAIH